MHLGTILAYLEHCLSFIFCCCEKLIKIKLWDKGLCKSQFKHCTDFKKRNPQSAKEMLSNGAQWCSLPNKEVVAYPLFPSELTSQARKSRQK